MKVAVNSHHLIDSDIDHDNDVVLYPTFGHLDRSGREWQVGVAGLICEPGPDNLRRRLLLRLIRKLLKVPPEHLEGDLFQQRIRGFLSVPERGKQITVRFGDRTRVLPQRSRRNGHFRCSLRLTETETAILEQSGAIQDGWLNLEVVTRPSDSRKIAGRAQLIGPSGLSVITDIDDTIKHSDVRHRRALLTNTFLREFQEVPGMSEVFKEWCQAGAAFHYVSSSPWQLYPCLCDLMHRTGFPAGSIHLRSVRLQDPSILSLFIARRLGKRRVIGSILRAFPRRQFILVGDTGEKDPEIYGSAARRYPDRVQQIYLREVPGRTFTPQRYERAFRGLPPEMWHVFQDGYQLAQVVKDRQTAVAHGDHLGGVGLTSQI